MKCRTHDSIKDVAFNFNDEGYVPTSSYSVTSDFDEDLSISVKATDSDGNEFTITMESLNFFW